MPNAGARPRKFRHGQRRTVIHAGWWPSGPPSFHLRRAMRSSSSFSPRSVLGARSALPHGAEKVGCPDLPTLERDLEPGMGGIVRIRPAEGRTGSNRCCGGESVYAELAGGMAGCIASGDDCALEPGTPQNSVQDLSETGSDPIIDLPGGSSVHRDSGRHAGERGVVWAGGREDERIPPLGNGCECLILSPSELPFPFPAVHGPGRVEADRG